MPRARRIAVTLAAASLLAAAWAVRARTVSGPATAPRTKPPRAAPVSPRRGRTETRVAQSEPAPSPRPGRRIPFFHSRPRVGDVAKIARDLIEENRRALGLDAMPGELRVTREFDSLSGHHLRFEQTLGGVPVFGSEVSAHVAKDGRPLLVQADVHPLECAATVPDVAAAEATTAAVEWAADDEEPAAVESKEPRLVILPEGRRGRLAWRVDVRTDAESSRVFVDAADGEVVRTDSLRVGVDGVGAVFEPNPIYSLRDGSLRDSKDNDSPALTAARVIVTLRRLDGSGFLRGQWADVTPTRGATNSPALDWSGVTRGLPEFEEVMAYYHVDRAQQRLQDLGVLGVNDETQHVDAHALSDDQSYYDAFNDVIRFGDGGVDDAEDADIIRHEYGHAIQFSQVRDWGVFDEGAAMGEGFGDFHAVSFHSGDPLFDPLVGSWDASSYSKASPPYLRRVDGNKHYPESLKSEPHADGEIWSRFLWDLRALIGNDDAVRVVVESHFLVTPTARFVQGADAILLTNESLRGGRDDVAIRDLLEARGLLYSVPLADPPADDTFEPNDDLDHAAQLQPGFRADLVYADEDWYRLDVPANRRFHVTMNSVPDRANLELELSVKTAAVPPAISVNELVQFSNAIDGRQEVDANAGPEGASFLLRVHDGRPGTHVAAYDLNVTDADLVPLQPGRSTLARLTARAPSVFRLEVPPSKVNRRLRVSSVRRRKGGTASEVRIVSPSGIDVVAFGAGKDRGSRARLTLHETGPWIIEVRSRDEKPGFVKLRAVFD